MNLVTLFYSLAYFKNVKFIDARCVRFSHGFSIINGEAVFDSCEVSNSLGYLTTTTNVGFIAMN